MNYRAQTYKLLEFDLLLEQLSLFFLSEYGRYFFLQSLESELSKSEIVKQYKQIGEFQQLKAEFPNFPIHAIHDFSGDIEKMNIDNYFIDLETITKLKYSVVNVRDIKQFFKESKNADAYRALLELSNTVFYDTSILREIDKVISEDGEVKSSASKDLKTIRERKKSIFSIIDKAFQSALSKVKEAGHLNEILESVRQGRRVLAVNAAYKRSVKGMVVDESDTGNIVFIEPEETIFLNNEASEIDREEQREIRKILIELTKFLSKYDKLILQYQESLAIWDTIQARVRFMNYIEGSTPILGSFLDLQNAFHPLLKIKNRKERKIIVPFHLKMDTQKKMLMISGPNAGGKSITLKTIGLISLMLRHAIPIAAESGSTVPLYEHIIGDLGDLQSIDDELSTYSSKLCLWKHMLAQVNNNTLLLFDELGDGTDPSFGAAMAQTVLETALASNSIIVATTHYGDIKKFSDSREDTINAHMMFDEAKLEPLYKLSIGSPGSSYTFHIARKMGLSDDIVKRAESISANELVRYDKKLFKIEKKEKELYHQRKEVERMDRELKKQMKDWNRLHLDLDLTRKKIKYDKLIANQEQSLEKEKELKSFKEDLKKKQKQEDLLAEQARIEEERKRDEEESKRLYKEIHKVPENQNFKLGDRVQFIQTDAIGIIDRLDKKKATVIFDNIKSTIDLSELIILEPEEEEKRNVPKKIVELDRNSPRELDIRGMYVYEAIPELEDFINRSLLNNYPEIKIIHGKGNLRKEILKELRTFKSISRMAHAQSENGGDGVTFVYF